MIISGHSLTDDDYCERTRSSLFLSTRDLSIAGSRINVPHPHGEIEQQAPVLSAASYACHTSSRLLAPSFTVAS